MALTTITIIGYMGLSVLTVWIFFFFFVYLPSPNLGFTTQLLVGQMPVERATVFGPEH